MLASVPRAVHRYGTGQGGFERTGEKSACRHALVVVPV